MINEIAVAAALTISGSLLLTAVRRDVTAAARCWLSVPIGAAAYLLVALVSLVFFDTLDPVITLIVVLGLGLVVVAVSLSKGGLGRDDLLWMMIGLGTAIFTALAARQWHLTRLTPDSLRYLLASNDLVLTGGLREMNATDLVTRQIGLPALQSLSDVVGRGYLASIGPLFGVFGIGLFTWLALDVTRGGQSRRNRLILVGAAILFLASSNRLVYDSFYINTHIQMASYLLIAIAGIWLAVSRGLSRWAIPSGLALAVTLVFRPEAPLVVAIVLVTVAASRADMSIRLATTLPTLAVGTVWYGLGLWRYAAGGDEISPTAPVFGSLLAIVVAVILCLAGGADRARSWARWLDVAGVAGLALLLAFYVATDPAVFGMSIEATARNLVRDGFWLLTWVAALALLMVAMIVQAIPDARLWTVPIIGFALLYWALPYVREGAWRVGAGDSGNRILAHYLAVTVIFLVLAAVHNRGSASMERVESV
ncbi:MAG TPA: hypothetical protein VFU96_09915 [Acidimicrobiia bacterium]|nr:hypothetical protein [Acidimicrobiia bacterium]